MWVLRYLPRYCAVVVDDGRGVVVDAVLLDLVDRNDQRDVECFGEVLHQPDGGAVGDGLGEVVPAGGLLGAEVRAVEDLLEADDLGAGLRRIFYIGDVLVEHRLLGHFERAVGSRRVGGLDQGTPDVTH